MNASGYYDRGNAFYAKKENDRAIADYSMAMEIDPKNASGYSNHGESYRRNGEYDRAIEDFGKAFQLEPKDLSFVSKRGFARFYKGEFKGASADLQLAMEPKDNTYVMLFRFLAQSRAGEIATSELEANAPAEAISGDRSLPWQSLTRSHTICR